MGNMDAPGSESLPPEQKLVLTHVSVPLSTLGPAMWDWPVLFLRTARVAVAAIHG